MIDVMLVEDRINFLGSQIVAQLREGVAQSSWFKLTIAFCVELLEQACEPLARRVFLHRECGREELVIMDDTGTGDVDFH